MKWTVLKSSEDDSVNFVLPQEYGSIETRYVRRVDDYFIVYLSSHTGCKHACRFCHLTANRETYFEPVDVDLYLEQALRVLTYYDTIADDGRPAKRVHFNWMARGEALSNPHLIDDGFTLIGCLSSLARERGLQSKFNISTIFPKDFRHTSLNKVFGGLTLDFYYSLYSLNESFRKRWIPRALPPQQALTMLADWQHTQHREVVLHWAFIDGENDTEAEVHAICDAVLAVDLKVRVNIVRYNSPNATVESPLPVIERNLAIMQDRLSPLCKIVPRVGNDVYASCGQFFTGE